MTYGVRILVVAAAIVAGLIGAARADEPAPQPEQQAAAEPVSFSKMVAPVLVTRCAGCHSNDKAEGEYRLTHFAALMEPGASGAAAITAGKPDESELLRRIASTDESERMPQEADPLPAEQIATIQRWIAEGANFDGPDRQAALASLVPRTAYPAAPEAYPRALPVTALTLSPAGDLLAVSGYHEFTLWNPATGALVRRVGDVPQRTYDLRFSPDGSLVALAGGTPGERGDIALYRSDTGELVRQLATLGDVALGVAFSPAGDKLAACAADRTIRVFDVAKGEQILLVEDHADWVVDIAWNHDGTRLVSASRDKTSKVFDAVSGESLVTYRDHGQPLLAAAFSEDGNQVFSAGADNKVHVWALADAKRAGDIGGFSLEVTDLTLAAGRLYACAADGVVRQYNAADRQQVRELGAAGPCVYRVAANPASGRVAAGGFDGTIRVWSTEDGAQVAAWCASPGVGAQQAAATATAAPAAQ